MKTKIYAWTMTFLKLAFCLSILTIPLTLFGGNDIEESFSYDDRQYLVDTFEMCGFNTPFLTKVFLDKRLEKLPVVISKNIYNKESGRSYSSFSNSYSMYISRRFSKRWRTVLKRASEKFRVDKEVLIAILLVETGFGNVLGRYPVISVFSSILIKNRDILNKIDNNSFVSKERQFYINRLKKKAAWAKTELIALLNITRSGHYSPFRLKGSFAGAFGIPQFLPSSFLKWGYDSDRNGSINLFLFPDAIFSTANYLRAHGWKKGLYRKSNKDVIYQYNNSHLYVNTILRVAKKLRVSERKRIKKRKMAQRLASNNLMKIGEKTDS